ALGGEVDGVAVLVVGVALAVLLPGGDERLRVALAYVGGPGGGQLRPDPVGVARDGEDVVELARADHAARRALGQPGTGRVPGEPGALGGVAEPVDPVVAGGPRHERAVPLLEGAVLLQVGRVPLAVG